MNRQVERSSTLQRPLTRRRGLQALAAGTSMVWSGIRTTEAKESSPNEKLNLACIGIGGRGSANVSGVSDQNLVALVDVDEQRAGKVFEKHPKAKRFRDYRKMLDALGDSLDGVVISTPDHTHFHPAFAAMQLGLHVYLEKPLAHNVWETRTLTNYAKDNGLATQLGAQRHAMTNMHRVVELVQSGAIGEVDEVYSWVSSSRGMPDIPNDRPPTPSSLDYDLWVGPAPMRPYHPSFCPYGWRFWWDYGTGETGNWGCHILDIPFWALGLKYPNRVDATGPDVDAERTPKSMHSTLTFPTSNQDKPVKLHWSQGKPGAVAASLESIGAAGESVKGCNNLFVGDKGMLLCGFNRLQLLPSEQFAEFKTPKPYIPDSPGFHQEWINACRGGQPATCDFDYSGPLAEAVLLANVAYRTGGFDWNDDDLSTGSNSAAQELIRQEYRPGWEIS